MPLVQEFMPTGQIEDEPIILNLDEYEAIRLMDREGMSQQECSKRMGVSRTTVQKIYEAARRKVADGEQGNPLCKIVRVKSAV